MNDNRALRHGTLAEWKGEIIIAEGTNGFEQRTRVEVHRGVKRWRMELFKDGKFLAGTLVDGDTSQQLADSTSDYLARREGFEPTPPREEKRSTSVELHSPDVYGPPQLGVPAKLRN